MSMMALFEALRQVAPEARCPVQSFFGLSPLGLGLLIPETEIVLYFSPSSYPEIKNGNNDLSMHPFLINLLLRTSICPITNYG